jgi:hypothetical protein
MDIWFFIFGITPINVRSDHSCYGLDPNPGFPGLDPEPSIHGVKHSFGPHHLATFISMKCTNLFIPLIAIAVGLASCGKKMDKPAFRPLVNSTANGVYVLVKGGTTINGQNWEDDSNFNSTLAFYDPATKTVTPDRFSQVNGFPLGWRATDMGIYGSKLYIAMEGEGNITVVDAATTRLIGRTQTAPPATGLYTSDEPSPAKICFFQGSVYIGLINNSIAVMDTGTLKITRTITFPNYPLVYPIGPVVANAKLYYAGFNDETGSVLVIDPQTGTVLRQIPTYIGPQSISADASGKVYVQTQWDSTNLNFSTTDYMGLTSGITVISSATDDILYQRGAEVPGNAPIVVVGNNGYYIEGNYATSSIGQFNAATLSFDLTAYNTGLSLGQVTALTADSASGQLFVGDSRTTNSPDGTVDVFANQQLQYSFIAGMNLIKIIPY